jgi:hypothetical protein
VRLGDVVDELHDEHGLADAGAAEEADLAALAVRGEEVDDLDAGLEDLDLGRLLDELGGRGESASVFLVRTGGPSSTGSPMTFRMRPRHSGPTGIAIGAPVSRTAMPRTRPSVMSIAIARTVFSPRCWATSSVRLSLTSRCRVRDLERVQDLRELAPELDVDDGADDLNDFAPAGEPFKPGGNGDWDMMGFGDLERGREPRRGGGGLSRPAAGINKPGPACTMRATAVQRKGGPDRLVPTGWRRTREAGNGSGWGSSEGAALPDRLAPGLGGANQPRS